MNRARVKIAILALVAFLTAIQFVQPKRTNPSSDPSRALTAHVQVPVQVHALLQRGCGDCHSNRTVWPWYSRVAPISWVVTDDVNEGRKHMNFDDWEAQQSPKQANDHIVDVCKELTEKGMPPFSYRLAHRELRLKAQEITVLCSWSRTFGPALGDGSRELP